MSEREFLTSGGDWKRPDFSEEERAICPHFRVDAQTCWCYVCGANVDYPPEPEPTPRTDARNDPEGTDIASSYDCEQLRQAVEGLTVAMNEVGRVFREAAALHFKVAPPMTCAPGGHKWIARLPVGSGRMVCDHCGLTQQNDAGDDAPEAHCDECGVISNWSAPHKTTCSRYAGDAPD